MELTYDWCSFRTTFQSHSPGTRSFKVVVQDSRIVAISGEDSATKSEWIGKSIESFQQAHRDTKVQAFEASAVEQWICQSLVHPDAYNQALDVHRLSDTPVSQHFLLKSLQGNWTKVFPSAFGIMIRLNGAVERDFFILMKQGKLSLFHRPELLVLGATRSEDLFEVVRYLTEKHSVPVQALSLSEGEWYQLTESAHPWRELAGWIKARKAELVPFRWPVVAWIATRAFL